MGVFVSVLFHQKSITYCKYVVNYCEEAEHVCTV